jgi:hypothetical protein
LACDGTTGVAVAERGSGGSQDKRHDERVRGGQPLGAHSLLRCSDGGSSGGGDGDSLRRGMRRIRTAPCRCWH